MQVSSRVRSWSLALASIQTDRSNGNGNYGSTPGNRYRYRVRGFPRKPVLFRGSFDRRVSAVALGRHRLEDLSILLRRSFAPFHYPGVKEQALSIDTAARQRAIDAALSQMDKQFGKGSVLRLGSRNVLPVAVIPTGSISLDAALGVGGFPRGRVVEVFGPESSGKTTLALQVIAQAQKAGGTAAFIDAEHALDPAYAGKLGFDVDNLLVSQPDYGEQALEIAGALIGSGGVDVIVVDSVAALVPKAELDGEMGDSHMGLHARLMSQALRKLTGTVARTNTLLVFINQVREKIGVMFGNPETTTGGRALKFYSSVRVEVRRMAAIKEGEKVVGNRTKVKIVKNKVAAPFREAEVDILYGQGVSREGDLLDLGVIQELVEKSGSWFSYSGQRIGQGRENARTFLCEKPALADRLDAELRTRLGFSNAAGPGPIAAASDSL